MFHENNLKLVISAHEYIMSHEMNEFTLDTLKKKKGTL